MKFLWTGITCTLLDKDPTRSLEATQYKMLMHLDEECKFPFKLEGGKHRCKATHYSYVVSPRFTKRDFPSAPLSQQLAPHAASLPRNQPESLPLWWNSLTLTLRNPNTLYNLYTILKSMTKTIWLPLMYATHSPRVHIHETLQIVAELGYVCQLV